jgi:chromosome segregation ATPase
MRPSAVRVLSFWALVLAAGTGGSLVIRAQQAPGATPDVLPALLTEVRGLRAAMEQMASAGPRVQLALGRLQLQEQRIQNLVRRLEQVRNSQSGPQRDYERLTDRLKDMAEELPSLNESGRRQYEAEMPMMKKEIERLGKEIQKLVNEEAFVNQEISSEQARWTDFNQRLEELERSLVRR